MASMHPYERSPLFPNDGNPDGSGVEDALNAMSDQDVSWWPFLELRPQTHEHLSTRRVLKMSLCYGPLLAMILLLATIQHASLQAALTIVIAAIALSFVIYRVTFAVAWNRRAERLQPPANG
ncbi:MAG: hypothetical protein ABI461_04435 [Polyangiaceae bacterium]